MSEFVGSRQIFQRVSAGPDGAGPKAGTSRPLVGSYCTRVLDGRLQSLIPNARRDLMTRDLPITEEFNIGAYIGAPIYRANGHLHGMLCCISHTPRTDLGEREAAILALLAQMLGDLADRSSLFGGSARDRRDRIVDAIAGHGRHLALQPIVDIRRGAAIAVEALSRFDSPPPPDGWFADAVSVNLGVDLELACAQSALDAMKRSDLPNLVSVNLSPEAFSRPAAARCSSRLTARASSSRSPSTPRSRTMPRLTKALAPHREAGALVAIDDAGAGYASFRHILRLAPAFIKVDIALIRDIDTDPVRQALITALSTVADTAGARLIAEGIETQAELDTLLGARCHARSGLPAVPPDDRPVARRLPPASPSAAAAGARGLSGPTPRPGTRLARPPRPACLPRHRTGHPLTLHG